MSKPAVVALFGAGGRTGREVLKQTWRFDTLDVKYGYDIAGAGETVEKVKLQKPPNALPEGVQLVIDFSAADAVLAHLDLALSARAAYICAVTSLSEEILNELRASANEIPVLQSANFSAGMNVMFKLAVNAAHALPGYERHIFETHHAAKKDAPSGSALHLAGAIREAGEGDTEITAVRMGDVTGEHRILFGGPGERLEIIHHADSRAVFAVGALRAAEWLIEHRSAGFYRMSDVLGL
jgi:4-hydroxy-tetrahydrodipicolinate reductase